ncbi:hypothetical protein [Streptomyces sp. NPDC051173]|uniref:hypothetical protein n=1 Tax=Streptomyces sp. NPDC051173 TaxID=3155164 RepID=UPI00344D6087
MEQREHAEPGSGYLLIAVEQLTSAHDRYESERSDVTSSQNSAGDDGENRDLNLPKA